MPMGIIYIAQNQTYGPNVYKVGKTERTNVRERMQELTGDTGVLGEFNELGWALVDDVDDCEKKCHTKLNKFRIQQNREFFEIDLGRLVSLIRENISDKIIRDELPEQGIFLYPEARIWVIITFAIQKLFSGEQFEVIDHLNQCRDGTKIGSDINWDKIPEDERLNEMPFLGKSMDYFIAGQFTLKRRWDETIDWAITHGLSNKIYEFINNIKNNEKNFFYKPETLSESEIEEIKKKETIGEKEGWFEFRFYKIDGWHQYHALKDYNSKIFKIGNYSVEKKYFFENDKIKENLWPPLSLYNKKKWTGWKIDKKNKKLLYVPHSKEFPLV